jgi:hypothetical protein
MEAFDQDRHEADVAERYRRLALFDAFDQFVDMALDNVISMPEALQGFAEEYGEDLKATPAN